MGILFLLAFRLTSNQEAIASLRGGWRPTCWSSASFSTASASSGRSVPHAAGQPGLLEIRRTALLLMLAPLGLVLISGPVVWIPALKPGKTALVSLKLAGEGDLTKVRLETATAWNWWEDPCAAQTPER